MFQGKCEGSRFFCTQIVLSNLNGSISIASRRKSDRRKLFQLINMSHFLPPAFVPITAPPTLLSIGYPAFFTTIACAVIDILLVYCVFPREWRSIHKGSVKYSYYLSAFLYQLGIFTPLGFLIWQEYGYSLNEVSTSTSFTDGTHSKWAIVHSYFFIAYMIRDIPNCTTQLDLLAHHVLVIVFTLSHLFEPEAPFSLYALCGSAFEVPGATNNIALVLTEKRWKNIVFPINALLFTLSHLFGLYWCFIALRGNTRLWFKIMCPAISIPVMYLRQYYSTKLFLENLRDDAKKSD